MSRSVYILDTSSFTIVRHYYRLNFPSFWKMLRGVASSKLVTSVREVRDEIRYYGGKQKDLLKWVDSNARVFTALSDDEKVLANQIVSTKEGQALVKSNNDQPQKPPIADPYLIARAVYYNNRGCNAIVVTQEKRSGKGSSKKIPAVCNMWGVQSIDTEIFMADMGWKFK